MNARNAALETLLAVGDGAFSNLEVNKTAPNVEPRDRGLYTNLVFGVLQHKLTLDAVLRKYITRGFNRLKPAVKTALELAVYQIFYTERIPDRAAVDEAVNQIKKSDKRSAGFANAVLRNILRNRESLQAFITDSKNPETQYSIPQWIIDAYTQTYGNDAPTVLSMLNDKPPLTFRVFPEEQTSVMNELEKLGAQPEMSSIEGISDQAILIANPGAFDRIDKLTLYKNGEISVQDQGSVLIGAQAKAEPNTAVLDLCAAPGGKTTHMAGLMQNTGSVTACDLYENRLELVKKTASRQKLTNVQTLQLDATEYYPDFEEAFDTVLCDVPCSGLGVIRRKPDLRYRTSPEDVNALVPIQKQILSNAARYVKPGGRLVYSTCTTGNAENEDVTNAFLSEQNAAFTSISESHTSPLMNGADCFYYRVMEKTEK